MKRGQALATRDVQTQTTSTATPAGRTYTIIAFVLAAVAVLIVPILLGPLAAILAGIGMSKGDPLARWALVTAIVCTVAGFALGYAAFEAMNN